MKRKIIIYLILTAIVHIWVSKDPSILSREYIGVFNIAPN